MTGLGVYVYRDGTGDCTKGGMTSKYNRFTLIGEGVEGPFEPDEDSPALVLVRRKLVTSRSRGQRIEYLHAVPLKLIETGAMVMFGGNFIHTSDSRFPCDYPIPVHDRVE